MLPDRKKILIILPTQFGYHTDTLMYTKYLDSSRYELYLLGLDLGLERIKINDAHVTYVKPSENKIMRWLYFLSALLSLRMSINLDLVFHVHTKFSLFVRMIFAGKRYILDIRTGDLKENTLVRNAKNFLLRLVAFFCKNITIVSVQLGEELKISPGKCHLLPLGGEELMDEKTHEKILRLLYIGTFTQRNIHETIWGLKLFLDGDPTADLSYTIIGSGSDEDLLKMENAVQAGGLQKIVKVQGYIKNTEIEYFLKRADLGIVYIPQKKYYQYQPSTKLYEFLLAGIPVIATNTVANREIVKENFGLICDDNAGSFAKALSHFVKNRGSFLSEQMRAGLRENTWKNIVKHNLEPYFEKILIS